MSSSLDHAAELSAKIAARKAHVAVIGMGYVGLPLAVEFAHAGLKVTGIDVSERRVAAIMAGESYIGDVPTATLAPLVSKGLISASLPGPVLGEADAISICVPTPLRKSKDPDISYIVAATEEIARYLRPGQLIVLESTTYPGTTEEIMQSRLEQGGLRAGRDFFLCFSPERVDPGNAKFNTRNTPKVVGGVTKVCADLARRLYELAVDTVVPVEGTQTAEMVKLLENTFRSVNIGLVNELAIMCDRLGVNVWEVIRAAATKPFGYMPFWPGPGLGGHCIPIDPHYLSWKLKTLNYHARFIELADEVNSHMPDYVVAKAQSALNEHRLAVNGAKVLVLGLAYKKNVADCRESPAIDIVHHLRKLGAEVSWCDPWANGEFPTGEDVPEVAYEPAVLAAFDCIIVATDHDVFKPSVLVEHARLIVDARNLTRDFDAPSKIRRI